MHLCIAIIRKVWFPWSQEHGCLCGNCCLYVGPVQSSVLLPSVWWPGKTLQNWWRSSHPLLTLWFAGHSLQTARGGSTGSPLCRAGACALLPSITWVRSSRFSKRSFLCMWKLNRDHRENVHCLLAYPAWLRGCPEMSGICSINIRAAEFCLTGSKLWILILEDGRKSPSSYSE